MDTTQMALCTRCLEQNPSAQRHCGGCGAPLESVGMKAADEIRTATVVFADVADFTRLSSELSLEKIKLLMDTIFSRLYEVVLAHGGVVDKYIGDCLMALFGVPRSRGDDAARGVRAALAMQRALEDMRSTLEQRGLPDVHMRVGLESGSVIAGPVGAGPQRRYTVMGSTVNLAAHLQQEAPVDAVVIGPGCQRRIRGVFQLDPYATREGAAFIVACEHTGEGLSPPRELLGSGSRLVGRDAQLAWLSQQLAAVIEQRRAQLTNLVGPAGIGKTGLLVEYLARVDEQREADRDASVTRVVARGHALSRATPFAVFADGLKRQIGLYDLTDRDRVTRRLKRFLQTIASFGGGPQDERRDLETLWMLLDPPTQTFGAAARIKQVSDFVCRVFEVVCSRRPTMLVIEEADDADPATVQCLAQLLQRLERLPFWVVAAGRASLASRLASFGNGFGEDDAFPATNSSACPAFTVNELTLTGLDSEAVGRLLEQTLGQRVSKELAAWITSGAEGNPRRVEEIVRSLRDSGALSRRISGWELARPSEEVRAIGQVAAMDVARRRLSLLSHDQQLLLSRAALIGPTIWRGALEVLLPQLERFDSELALAVERELLAVVLQSRLSGERELVFLSDALQRVAYDSLSTAERPALHCQVAQWLQSKTQLAAKPSTEHVALLVLAAEHYEKAGSLPQAAATFGQAGDLAYRVGSLELANTQYERASALVAEPPLLFEHLARQERVLNALGRFADQRQVAKHMIDVAEQLQDRARLVEALLRVGRSHLNVGEHEMAKSRFKHALSVAEERDDRVDQARALRWMAMIDFNRSAHRAALPTFERALCLASDAGDEALAAELAYELAVTVGTVGDYSRALDVSMRALEMFEQQQNRYQIAFCLGNIGCFHTYLGELEAAGAAFERASALAAKIGAPLAEASALANLANARRLDGAANHAVDIATRAVEQARGLGDPRLLADALVYLALAMLAADGDPIAACEVAQQSLSCSRSAELPGAEAAGCLALARAHTARDQLGQALELASAALRILTRLGSIEGLEHQIQLTWIELMMVLGKEELSTGEAVETVLGQACEQVRTKAGWIGDLQRRERFLAIPHHARLLALCAERQNANDCDAPAISGGDSV
jgi:class 3 adenylate cyclase/predicted ATPase